MPTTASSSSAVTASPSATRSQPRRRGRVSRMWPAKHSSASSGSSQLRPLSTLMPRRAVEKPSEVSSGMRPSTEAGMASAIRAEAALAQPVLDAVDGLAEIEVDDVAVEREPVRLAGGQQRHDGLVRAPVRRVPQLGEAVRRHEAVEALADRGVGAGLDRRGQHVGVLGAMSRASAWKSTAPVIFASSLSATAFCTAELRAIGAMVST